MALRHIDVTLGATATKLSSTRYGIRQATIQNVSGNGAIYIGVSTVTNTSFGASIADGIGTVTLGPFSGDAPCNTDEVYLYGTQNKVVHCLLVTH
jgi:hypothetical protein